MTQTRPKRLIRTPFSPHAHGLEGHTMRPHYRRDAAEMAATLRSLATRAHQAVKAHESGQRRLAHGELAELKSAIHQLEDDFRGQDLHDLVPYVAALRHQVERRLA
jgi:hypothetical protein